MIGYLVSHTLVCVFTYKKISALQARSVNAFTKNVYLYEQDEFGTLTIYRLITIKNVVKTIDTFIYDKKLVECLLKTLYEEGR